MGEAVVSAGTLEELAGFVHRVLCQQDSLDPDQTPLKQSPVKRAGRACGLMFQVDGPRQLRTAAVWAADEGRVLFYDSIGRRVREVRLSESPRMEEDLAADGRG